MPRKRSLEQGPNGGGLAVADSPETPDTPAPLPENQKPTLKSTRLTLPDYQRMSLREAMQKMTEDDWSDKQLYLYRSAPFTNNKHTGKRYGYIFNTGYPGISEEEMQQNFGGGQFRAYMKMGKYTCAEQLYAFPGKPKLKDDEVLTTPDTQTAAQNPAASAGLDLGGVKDLLRMFLEAQRQQKEEAGDEEGASALTKAIELVSSGAAEAQKLIVSANKPPDMNAQLEFVQKIMALAAPKQDDTTKAILLKMLDRAFPATPPAPAANPIDQMKASFEAMKTAKEVFADLEGAASGDWKSTLVAALVPAIPQVLTLIRAAANRPPQVIVMQPGPGGQLVPVAARATPPTLETVPIEPPSPEAVSAPSASPSAASAVNPSPDLLSGEALKLRVVTMFLKGKDGALVASFIEDAAPTVYAALSKFPAEMLKQHFAGDAILNQIANEAGIDDWLKEFTEYIHEQEETEEAPTPEPASVQ